MTVVAVRLPLPGDDRRAFVCAIVLRSTWKGSVLRYRLAGAVDYMYSALEATRYPVYPGGSELISERITHQSLLAKLIPRPHF